MYVFTDIPMSMMWYHAEAGEMRRAKIALAINQKIVGRIDRLVRVSAKIGPKLEKAFAELETAASAAGEDFASSEVNLGESVNDIKEYP